MPPRDTTRLLTQTTISAKTLIDHLSTIDEVERRMMLDFMREQFDDVETRTEGERNESWAGEHFADRATLLDGRTGA